MKLSLFDRLTQQRQGKIYIFPTKAGWGFMLLLFLLLILSINFENNLAFALTFLLSGIMVVAILHTYSNLVGVTIDRSNAQACFAGEEAGFTLFIGANKEREHQQIQVSWVNRYQINSVDRVVAVDLIDSSQVAVELSLPSRRRGWCTPTKVKLQTVFPLGLFRSWSYHSISAKALVYPSPVSSQNLPATSGAGGQGGLTEQSGSDDFSELKRFEAGMSPQHIAWKVYARGQGLHAKRFASRQDLDIWLDYDAWPEADQELRLSRICYWVLKLHREDRCYGVRLPDREWPPSQGDHHRQQILQALALFGLGSRQ
jgi:uncharacterized protein (DUF58 family)